MVIKTSEIWRNEEGSALSSVLIISVIILTFIGAILSGILLQARFIQKDINKTKANYAAEKQLFEYLSNPEIEHSGIQIEFQNGFEQVQSSAIVGNTSITVQAIVGERNIVLVTEFHSVMPDRSSAPITTCLTYLL